MTSQPLHSIAPDQLESPPVVVGIDGSTQARTALRWAAQWAHVQAAPLTVLTAANGPSHARSLGGSRADATGMRQQMIREIAAVAARHPDLTIEPETSDLSPQAALTAASKAALALVVGARGAGGWVGLATGSVANELPAHADCPVIIVPESVRPTSTNRPVVVGYDGSNQASQAVAFGLGQARRWQQPLIIVRAESPRHRHAVLSRVLRADELTREQHVSTEQLRPLLRLHDDVAVEVRHVRQRPAHALARLMTTASMVVVGATGAGNASALGSTTRAALNKATTPIAVIPR